MITCNYRSAYSDSGDRGADMADHYRSFHPDHTHVWGDSTYDWEQAGEPFIQWPYRLERNETVQRCTVCSIQVRDDQTGKC